ncbi:MAG: lipid-A-disaccharide synthase, partial [Planctomycetia bacterium]|nr:lipid-A-disaccharide synthase [Planctomycetia bacterium]
MDSKENPRIFISAGETSGDIHAASLIRAIRRQSPGAEIFGLGGDRMEECGCQLLAHTTGGAVMFIAGIPAQITGAMKRLSALDRHFARHRPDVVVLVDCPGFNFMVASRARVRRIPVIWYIPPQLWAWGGFRIKKLRRRVTRVACVFEHEEKFFKANGVEATFVGHPLAEHLRAVKVDKSIFAPADEAEKLVAIFPGSRSQEVRGELPRIITVAQALKARLPEVRFVIGCPDERIARLAKPIVDASGLKIDDATGQTYSLMASADLALVVSGTATLELAWFATPM